MGTPYKSAALAAVHETALGLAEGGLLSAPAMTVFDKICLAQVEAAMRSQTRQLRRRAKRS